MDAALWRLWRIWSLEDPTSLLQTGERGQAGNLQGLIQPPWDAKTEGLLKGRGSLREREKHLEALPRLILHERTDKQWEEEVAYCIPPGLLMWVWPVRLSGIKLTRLRRPPGSLPDTVGITKESERACSSWSQESCFFLFLTLHTVSASCFFHTCTQWLFLKYFLSNDWSLTTMNPAMPTLQRPCFPLSGDLQLNARPPTLNSTQSLSLPFLTRVHHCSPCPLLGLLPTVLKFETCKLQSIWLFLMEFLMQPALPSWHYSDPCSGASGAWWTALRVKWWKEHELGVNGLNFNPTQSLTFKET